MRRGANGGSLSQCAPGKGKTNDEMTDALGRIGAQPVWSDASQQEETSTFFGKVLPADLSVA